jgi:ribosomal protein S18 acetylase RimI-like enzyme
MSKIEIQIVPFSEKLKQQIYEGFREHAIATIGFDETFAPVSFVASDEGQFAGAVVVELFWGTLHVKYVFVKEEYRKQGIATKLMQKAFEYGKEHKCAFAFVETMSFQALGFYQKLGFVLEYTRSGYSHGTAFHYLRKDLAII